MFVRHDSFAPLEPERRKYASFLQLHKDPMLRHDYHEYTAKDKLAVSQFLCNIFAFICTIGIFIRCVNLLSIMEGNTASLTLSAICLIFFLLMHTSGWVGFVVLFWDGSQGPIVDYLREHKLGLQATFTFSFILMTAIDMVSIPTRLFKSFVVF